MVQTLSVYLFLLFSITFFINKTFKIKGLELSNSIFGIKNAPFIIAIILFSVIMGMRYGVGVDHLKYLKYYIDLQSPYYSGKKMEIAFQFITKFFGSFSLHYSIYFSFLAFLQFFFLLYTFKRNEPKVLPFIVITLILGGVFFSYMNGIRQQIAFCIFVFSIEFIFRKKFLAHYILLIIAFMFHSSIIIISPIYFIFQIKKPYFKNRTFQLVILSVSLFFLYQNYIFEIFSILEETISILGYGKYTKLFETDSKLMFSLKRSRGLGFFILLAIDIILITYSNKIKAYFKDSFLPILYDLYFIGVIYGYIVNGSIMLTRINYYFGGFKYIIAAYALLFFYNKLKESYSNIIMFTSLIVLYILIFVAILYRMNENTVRFIFFWQEHLHYLKAQ